MGKVIRGMLMGVILSPLVVFLSLTFVLAQENPAKTNASALPDKAAEKKRAELRKKIEAKKKEINGGEWQVTLKSMSGKGAMDGSDVLTFQNNVFRSQSASKLGFTPTNYTLTVSEFEEGPTVWETMQTGGKGEVMFWRGEWLGKNMTGVITRQLEEGKTEEYSFSSSSMKEIPETSESEEPAQEIKGEKSTETLKSGETSSSKGKKKR